MVSRRGAIQFTVDGRRGADLRLALQFARCFTSKLSPPWYRYVRHLVPFKLCLLCLALLLYLEDDAACDLVS
jgi:hypothetical protein